MPNTKWRGASGGSWRFEGKPGRNGRPPRLPPCLTGSDGDFLNKDKTTTTEAAMAASTSKSSERTGMATEVRPEARPIDRSNRWAGSTDCAPAGHTSGGDLQLVGGTAGYGPGTVAGPVGGSEELTGARDTGRLTPDLFQDPKRRTAHAAVRRFTFVPTDSVVVCANWWPARRRGRCGGGSVPTGVGR